MYSSDVVKALICQFVSNIDINIAFKRICTQVPNICQFLFFITFILRTCILLKTNIFHRTVPESLQRSILVNTKFLFDFFDIILRYTFPALHIPELMLTIQILNYNVFIISTIRQTVHIFEERGLFCLKYLSLC